MPAASNSNPEYLNRYTSLPVLLDMLQNKHITFLPPKTWADTNDSYYLERYQEERNLATVLALCFTTKRETFHHWKVFSDGMSGVCIKFKFDEFMEELDGRKSFRSGEVKYYYIEDLEKKKPPLEKWPFTKRKAFGDEGEYRIIYENKQTIEPSKSVSFDITCLKHIMLSPWMPQSIADSVKEIIEKIPECSGITVQRSHLLENGRWKRIIDTKPKLS